MIVSIVTVAIPSAVITPPLRLVSHHDGLQCNARLEQYSTKQSGATGINALCRAGNRNLSWEMEVDLRYCQSQNLVARIAYRVAYSAKNIKPDKVTAAIGRECYDLCMYTSRYLGS